MYCDVMQRSALVRVFCVCCRCIVCCRCGVPFLRRYGGTFVFAVVARSALFLLLPGGVGGGGGWRACFCCRFVLRFLLKCTSRRKDAPATTAKKNSYNVAGTCVFCCRCGGVLFLLLSWRGPGFSHSLASWVRARQPKTTTAKAHVPYECMYVCHVCIHVYMHLQNFQRAGMHVCLHHVQTHTQTHKHTC